jgi:hypothetical protein
MNDMESLRRSEQRQPPVHCESRVVDLSGHKHGPGCGHDVVQHDDHYDFLGDDGELHHEVREPNCCQMHEGLDEPLFVSHGLFSPLLLEYVVYLACLFESSC